MALFKKLGVDVFTRWRTTLDWFLTSQERESDKELQMLPLLDALLAFEDYSRVCEREFEEKMRREQVEKTRTERKARETFKDLLLDLRDSGEIKARSKWKSVYPAFQNDERYLNLLGNPGSNPLELFWDVVDNLDLELDAKISYVEDAIHIYNKNVEAGKPFEFNPETTEDEFRRALSPLLDGNTDLQELSDEDLKEVYASVRSLWHCLHFLLTSW